MNSERDFQAGKEEPNQNKPDYQDSENKPDYQDSENSHEIRILELSQMIVSSPTAMGTVVSSPTAMGTVECILP